MEEGGEALLLSIVIPVYNAESYLEARLKSLLRLDLENTQIIVVDDGSTDRSNAICQEYLAQTDNAVVIRQKNKGLSAARNRGMESADGEYILFLDSDDVLLEKGFIALKEYLYVSKPDVLMGKFVIMQEKGRNIWPDYAFPDVSTVSLARVSIYSEITDSVWNAWRYICSKDFLFRNDLFFEPGIICEDMEWTPRVLRNASHIEFLEEPFYGYYYNRPGSITRTAVVQRAMDVNKIVAGSVPEYISEEYGEVIAYRMIRESFFSISRYCQCKKNDRKKLRPVIESAIDVYHYSSSSMIRIFLKTQRVIPLYMWSASLLMAKATRGLLKGVLGPLRLKPANQSFEKETEKVFSLHE